MKIRCGVTRLFPLPRAFRVAVRDCLCWGLLVARSRFEPATPLPPGEFAPTRRLARDQSFAQRHVCGQRLNKISLVKNREALAESADVVSKLTRWIPAAATSDLPHSATCFVGFWNPCGHAFPAIQVHVPNVLTAAVVGPLGPWSSLRSGKDEQQRGVYARSQSNVS